MHSDDNERLANHPAPLNSERFVLDSVITGIWRIVLGLSNQNIRRDTFPTWESKTIPDRRFPLADYEEALTYLTGSPHDDEDMSIAEFKEALVREFKKHL